MKKKNRIFTYIKTVFLAFACIGIMSNSIMADAAEYDTDITSIVFHDHTGMLARAYINGKWEYIYCIQRGYPFRSYVSDLQMVYANVDGHEGTIASNIRYLLTQMDDDNDMEYFRGWGNWELNGDHTDADTQTSTDGAPASEAWNEAFTEFKEDDEDDAVQNRYTGSGSVRRWLSEVKPNLTGHEGALPVRGISRQKTRVKEISYAEAGVDTSQIFAFAMTNYYCNEDSDTAGYSEEAKYQAKQAMDWAIEYGFITTTGPMGDNLSIVYKDSDGKYGHGSSTYSGSCDGYIRTTIDPSEQYEAMKLYRQVVWKTTNMRAIPSFAAELKDLPSTEPIKLYWDEDIKKYTATVSDANGVLNYFDFEIPGVNITNNGDGTLTITSDNEINGELTSLPKASRLEPADGVFKLPIFLRWSLEGTPITYKYTALQKDLVSKVFEYQETEESRESGYSEDRYFGPVFAHSHDYSPACHWYCEALSNVTHCVWDNGNRLANKCPGADVLPNSCTHENNTNLVDGEYTSHEHTSECHTHTKADCHEHTDECRHISTCPYYLNNGGTNHYGGQPNTGSDACDVHWACGKEHYSTIEKEISGMYIDWQDLIEYSTGQKIIDPTFAYIKVETVPHEFPAETDTEILLIADNDEWNDLTYVLPNGEAIRHCSHLRVGEKFHLKYIYSYTGASKGFKIEFSLENKPYYQYNYLARMQAPQNVTPIYKLRTGFAGDRFSRSSISVPHAKLVIEKTPITIRGLYTTPETAYTLNGTYTYDSGTTWNDTVYLDALTEDQYDDWYDNMAADDYAGANGGGRITSSNGSPMRTDFTVSKKDGELQITWQYDTEPEVFSSALVFATAYIEADEDENFTKNYFDDAYNYAKDEMGSTQYTGWYYDFEEHNNVGGVGYFSSEYTDPNGTQSDNLIPAHTICTQNNEYRTYAVKNKVWQSDVDIKVSNFVQNTGAGIAEHTYQDRGRENHDMNYNLYYTVDVENPKATIYENKQKSYDGQTENDVKTTPYNTASDVNEFDVNTMISWGSTGASQTGASYGNTIVVDHIKTGTTYIQREIPTVLATMTSAPKETMAFKIYPNHDRLIYEDYYSGASVSGTEINRTVSVTAKDTNYPSNEKTAVSEIFPAMNPNNYDMRPQNINGSNNVPDQYNQGSDILHHMNPATSFHIKLSNGEIKTVTDSNTKAYTQYGFEYNPTNRNNKVTFPSRRHSVMFFKYSKTNYGYNGSAVQSAVGEFRNTGKTQTESYYISQVLFKSNYTSKYMKELEAQGADYIKDTDAEGNVTDAWIDMVNQNKFAVVSAGQGFELKVTVKYENSSLTQYLARYFGADDAQNDILGSSNRVQHRYNDAADNSRQYCNISALTGKDDRNAPYYKNTERAYISSYSVLDRLAVNLVTGSNVFRDLYCFMSDNPDTVYSYSGIYNTPVIFERDIEYSEDFSVTTITYTMCVSHSNGIASNLQNMRFYTNQLAPDKRTPGIVEGTYDVSANGEHSITIWTPIIAATPFDYPNAMQDRYIGDAIELGYTIKTTGADDSIVHIVQ